MTAKLGRSRSRAAVRELDKKFPGRHIQGGLIPRGISPHADCANIRQLRNNATPEINTQGFQWMLPCNRDKTVREYASAHEGRYHWRTSRRDREELSALIQRAALDKGAPSQELAQYRNFEITSDILAMPFALGSFQSVNLSADELPQILTPKARQFFNVRYIGQDGGARHDTWHTTRQALNIEMKMVSTDRIEYPLMDLQQGDVNAFSTINDQLRFDMEMKIDELARNSMDANFSATGIKALLNIHPLIDQANMPDGNYLDLTDVPTYGPVNVLTISRLKAILNHIALWGFGFDPDGPITISSMLMSPLNARDSWDYISLVSGWNTEGETWQTPQGQTQGRPSDDPNQTVSQSMRDEIMRTGGMMQSGWGYSWATQYNARITKGRIYVQTNQPIGWYFTKSEWDKTIEWKDDPDHVEQNYGEVLQRKALQFYQPEMWRYRYLVVDF